MHFTTRSRVRHQIMVHWSPSVKLSIAAYRSTCKLGHVRAVIVTVGERTRTVILEGTAALAGSCWEKMAQDKNTNPILHGVFFINNKLHEVVLEEGLVKWTDTTCRKPRGYTVVMHRDVLRVTKEEGKENSMAFSIHHVVRKPNHQWIHATATLRPSLSPSASSSLPLTLSVIPSTAQGDVNLWIDHIKRALDRYQRPRRLLVFINPAAGGSTGVKTYRKLAAPLFELCDVITDVIVTENSSHAGRVLAEYDLSTVDGVVSVGGDGSFFQCFNGLLRKAAKDSGIDLNDTEVDPVAPPIPIGIIPAGSNQVMAQQSTLVNDPVTATLHIILGNQHQTIISGVHNEGKLLGFGAIIIGCGLTGDMCHWSETMRNLGRLRYLVSRCRALLQTPRSLRLTCSISLWRRTIKCAGSQGSKTLSHHQALKNQPQRPRRTASPDPTLSCRKPVQNLWHFPAKVEPSVATKVHGRQRKLHTAASWRFLSTLSPWSSRKI